MNLSIQEINLLLEALRAWEREPQGDAVSGSIMVAIFSREKDHSEDKMRRVMEKAELVVQGRREQSILVQAKLIQERNGLAHAEFLQPAR